MQLFQTRNYNANCQKWKPYQNSLAFYKKSPTLVHTARNKCVDRNELLVCAMYQAWLS